MPRLSNSLPKYRKHRASGQAVVTINGRDCYLGPHGTQASKREYDRLIGEWLANQRYSPQAEAAVLTVTELLARYWKYAKGYYRKDGQPTNEISALKTALRPVRELYGKQNAQDFGPLALEAVRQRMIDAGWSRTGINRAVFRIRRVFRWGVAKELIPAAVYESLCCVEGLKRNRTEARESEPVLPVSDEIINQTLPHLPAVVADLVRVHRLTGMRPAEACMMRPCDIDRTADVWLYRPESHKTQHRGRDREILLRDLGRGADGYCFRACGSEDKRLAEQRANRQTPLSCGNRPGKRKRKLGDRYDVHTYRRAIHRGCDKAFPAPKGMKGEKLKAWQSKHRWSPNRLRHTAATQFRREFGLEEAQILLGHSEASVTQIYAERDLAKGLEVARRIG